ncbi:MAG: hypothetical protein Harvfovirus60_3 [Harvfovirus sp.]|uniref:RING-CH-type domain-containing protein n=1 Tax=Harvfovirus sp. TaxID=2487768 RepID=A0A3G5A3L6_9VIRU|nr:MAG: hypothetical protein Harvfovirus60_3 [Harvfovirus sp.]
MGNCCGENRDDEEEQQVICRECKLDKKDDQLDNYLIVPCRCVNDDRYIHIRCINRVECPYCGLPYNVYKNDPLSEYILVELRRTWCLYFFGLLVIFIMKFEKCELTGEYLYTYDFNGDAFALYLIRSHLLFVSVGGLVALMKTMKSWKIIVFMIVIMMLFLFDREILKQDCKAIEYILSVGYFVLMAGGIFNWGKKIYDNARVKFDLHKSLIVYNDYTNHHTV